MFIDPKNSGKKMKKIRLKLGPKFEKPKIKIKTKLKQELKNKKELLFAEKGKSHDLPLPFSISDCP